MDNTRTKTTSVYDIGVIRPEFSNFLNDPKKQYSLHLTMIDCVSKENLFETTSGKKVSCFWCRHRFDWLALGCPLRYIPNQISKTLQSPVTNEMYTIKENVSNTDVSSSKYNVTTENYYETDGIFCSFNCCLAYITENVHIPMYSQSKYLLMNIYFKVNGITNASSANIKSAPSWRLLSEYGGHLSIEEFRQSFSKVEYTQSHVVKSIPRLKPVSILYECKKQL